MHTVDGEEKQNGEVHHQPSSLDDGELKQGRNHRLSATGTVGSLLCLTAWWALIAACYVLLILQHDLRAAPRRAIIILLIAGFVYALACRWLHGRWGRWSKPTRRAVVVAILLGAIGFRLLLLAVPPSLSDDVYRYRWDGRVQAAGLNPYEEPPGSASLATLRDPLWLRINYPTIRTIYGPLAQLLFAAAYRVDAGLLGFQAFAVLGDLLAIVLLLGCLQRWSLPAWQVALFAWAPLAALESASNAHFDSWPIAAVLLAVYASIGGARTVSTRAVTASTLALTAGILFKAWPAMLAPLSLARRPRWHIPLMAALVVAAYVPFRSAGFGLLQPWMEYTSRWLFNDAAFFLLRSLTGSLAVAKAIAAAIGLAFLITLWRRRVDPVRGNYWLLLLAIFMMPTIHPWYLLWPLPLAAAALDLGWITVTVLAPLSYWILVGAGPDSSTWIEPTWVRFAIWLPALAVWIRQTSRSGPAAPPAAT